jgi:diguanylate cyclase (GGDEF)-like protein
MISLPNYHLKENIYESLYTKTFRATRLSDNISVILKILQEDSYHLNLRAKFHKEFNFLKQINSPYIIKAHDYFTWQNQHILCLEDFGGNSLSYLAPYIKSLNLSQKLDLMILITQALADLHNHKIIHKDINPANIVFNIEQNIVKLIDLGLSVSLMKEITDLSNVQHLSGTLAYISPEQTGRMNKSIDYRSDYYSLGVTFYEILSQTLPFDTDEPLKLIHSHIALDPKPLTEINKKIPKVLSDLVACLMEKSADNRYQSINGLLADLVKCRSTIGNNEEIINFTLGSQDFSPRLVLSQKLYGREQEIAIIMDTFMRIHKGKAELLLINGSSGTGKSVLVHGIQKPLSYSSGYFIKGKFDQFKKEIPYYSFIQAFQELIRQILTEPQHSLELWKEKILAKLGNNAQIIIDVIPELVHIIGNQPVVQEISAEQAKHRFHHEFINFLSVFCAEQHPLVIYLDDLQWADLSSLQLLNLILSQPKMKYLLLIGAYRDNEVSEIDPLSVTLRNIEKHTQIQLMELKPLTLHQINEFLSDTLITSKDKTWELAVWCEKKTQGNPFFLGQFLNALVQKGILFPNLETKSWMWDITTVQTADITDNIIDLIIDKIQQLPEKNQEILKVAACLGNVFDLKNISLITQTDESEIANVLWECIEEELLISTDGLAQYLNKEAIDGYKATNNYPKYKFIHDRIQQAAYNLIPETDKEKIHLAIGRLWLSTFTPEEKNIHLFDILNHFTTAAYLIDTKEELISFIELNLQAAKKAKLSAAYGSALIYLNFCIALINKKNITLTRRVLFYLYSTAAEVAYLHSDFDTSKKLAAIALQHTKNLLEEAAVQLIQIKLLVVQDKLQESIDSGLGLLERFGLSFPKKHINFSAMVGLLKMEYQLNNKLLLATEKKENTHVPTIKMVVNILSALTVPIYYTNPKFYVLFLLAQIKIALRHGHNSTSPYVFASYGAILSSRLHRFGRAKKFAKLALHLQSKQTNHSTKARTHFIVSSMIEPWSTDLHKLLPALQSNYHMALQLGDLEFAQISIQSYSFYSFFAGKNLYETSKELESYFDKKLELARPSVQHALEILLKTQKFLCSPLPTDKEIESHIFENPKFNLNTVELSQMVTFQYASLQMYLAFLFKKPAKALTYINALRPIVLGYKGLYGYTIYTFFESLCLLSLLSTMSKIEKFKSLKIINKNLAQFTVWMKQSPENFTHIWHLIMAEKCRYEDKFIQALHHYEYSIRFAKKNDFVNDEALAQELLGEFYLEQQQDFSSALCLIEAQNQYRKIGSIAKAQDIARRYPELSLIHKTNNIKRTTTHKSDSQHSSQAGLDLATIIKATQTLSQEIVLNSLLKHLTQIVIESGGAQKGLLILKNNHGWSIETEKKIDCATIEILQNVDLDISNLANDYLPISLVNYVIRTKESVIVENALTDKIVLNDYYVQKNLPKSLLLMPISHQGNITGLLYLENNKEYGVFNYQHLEMLNIVSTQASISIENARLYANMEERINQRTEEIKELSMRDSLTGVPNRKAFDEKIHDEFERAKRSHQPLSVLIIDIDHFKKVNDSYGHLVGDECLQKMGEVLLHAKKRSIDFVARYGGEEFIFILPSTNLEGAVDFGNYILNHIRNIVLTVGDIIHPITASIGVASTDCDNFNNPKELINLADQQLYQAKSKGRNQVMSILNKP